jgi:hypothetical protein
MQFIKEFGSNDLVYDNAKKGTTIEHVSINAEIIDINYYDIINTQFTGGNVGQKFEQLKDDLNLGMYSKAPCGGFVNFYKVTGNMGNDYIIYSGVNEVSNSHYIVTIHKILKD